MSGSYSSINEVIKALKCCAINPSGFTECVNCPYNIFDLPDCRNKLLSHAAEIMEMDNRLIKEQEKEIRRLSWGHSRGY